MIIKFLGDLHGDFFPLYSSEIKSPEEFCVIQVGDFGFYPRTMEMFSPTEYPLYFIDGNHEDFDYLKSECERVGVQPNGTFELRPNLFYVPRGTILDIYGVKIGFLGGAESIDKAFRAKDGPRKGWWAEERVTREDVEKFAGKTVDVFVTHSPPYSVNKRNFPPLNLNYWGLPLDWDDDSSKMVEMAWGYLGMPMMFSGHMHKNITDGKATILGIGELMEYHVE